tara:strand:- start:126 stop:380 length:255 start_codon:yes stop_codon:yes gene_type:complete
MCAFLMERKNTMPELIKYFEENWQETTATEMSKIFNISIMDIYNILSNEAGWAWVADFADDNMPLPLDDNTPHGEDILIALAKM